MLAISGVTKKWWFVVRGNKVDIDLLESEWNKVEVQTGWKLQPLLSYADTVVNDAVIALSVPNNDAVTTPTLPTEAVPVTTDLGATTAAPPIVPVSSGATTTTRFSLPSTAPVLDLSKFTPVSLEDPSNITTVLESSSVACNSAASDSADKESFLAKSRLPHPPS